MHCFSAPDRLDECVERGYLCSFAGQRHLPEGDRPAGRPRARVPDELLLVETDSPYLAPQPVRGKPNEPANVVAHRRVRRRAARRVATRSSSALVERNAARVFGW